VRVRRKESRAGGEGQGSAKRGDGEVECEHGWWRREGWAYGFLGQILRAQMAMETLGLRSGIRSGLFLSGDNTIRVLANVLQIAIKVRNKNTRQLGVAETLDRALHETLSTTGTLREKALPGKSEGLAPAGLAGQRSYRVCPSCVMIAGGRCFPETRADKHSRFSWSVRPGSRPFPCDGSKKCACVYVMARGAQG
jgi:hypothetical protein